MYRQGISIHAVIKNVPKTIEFLIFGFLINTNRGGGHGDDRLTALLAVSHVEVNLYVDNWTNNTIRIRLR